jgi:N-acyl-D-aspartate/D-glutamate deacylase
MNHAQKYLAQANRQIAELAVQIAAQRAVVKHALDVGQGSDMAESLLHALESSLRIFERHRKFLLSVNGSASTMPARNAATG